MHFQQEPHLALQKHYDHLVHFIFIPAMNAFIQVPQQYRNFSQTHCIISLVDTLTVSSKIWTTLKKHCISKQQYVFMPAMLLMRCFFWLHLQKLSKIWQKSVFDHILWKSVGRPTITYDYPHDILSGKGKKNICSSISQIKSCSFLCVLYDQRIKRINWINALMYYLSRFKIICLSFTIHLYIFLTLYTYFCSSLWYTVEEINCILLWKKKKSSCLWLII